MVDDQPILVDGSGDGDEAGVVGGVAETDLFVRQTGGAEAIAPERDRLPAEAVGQHERVADFKPRQPIGVAVGRADVSRQR